MAPPAGIHTSVPGGKAMGLQQLLSLRHAPVAIALLPAAPPGIARVEEPAPSGCAYWGMAAEGKVFYTEARDHYRCLVGAHTHNVEAPPERAKELDGLIGTMVGLQYLRMEEVPSIPRMKAPFGVAVYAPLENSPVAPDVVLIRGNSRQLMLISEAAHAVGAANETTAMLRPTCAVIPESIQADRAALSLGCVGNRVYSGLGDDEMYLAIPGPKVEAITKKLASIVRANAELERFHQSRKTAL